jgi:hypothetical protein
LAYQLLSHFVIV